MARKYCSNVSLTILRIESFVETGVRDLENELFSKIVRVIS